MKLLENLRNIPFAPSVQMHDVPGPAFDERSLREIQQENANPDERIPRVLKDYLREMESDLMDLAEGGMSSGDRDQAVDLAATTCTDSGSPC